MNTRVDEEIAAAFLAVFNEDEIKIQETCYREAKEVVSTIPSGTRDVDLTSKQRRALNQYEDALHTLSQLRGAE